MITYIIIFSFIISKYAASSSILHSVNFQMNLLKIEICLTITNKNKSDEK